jgi:hypothetical protein
MMKKYEALFLSVVFSMILSSACQSGSVETEQSSETPTANALLPNYLIEANGNISLRRIGWSGFYPIGFGTPLKQGDLVRVAEGGYAGVFCGDASLWQAGSLELPADDQEHGIPCQAGKPPRPWPDVAALRGESGGEVPYVISPRNTALINPTPPLEWHPLSGVNDYTLSILSDDGIERTPFSTNGNESVWPEDWSPLEAHATYVLIVEGNGVQSDQGNETHSGLGFWLLDPEVAEDVTQQSNQLAKLVLNEPAKKLLVAELYLNHQLRSEAVQTLEVIASGSQDSAIWLIVGKGYLELGLPVESIQAFGQALKIAQDRGEAEAQASAHFGLGLALDLYNDAEEAQSHFQEALGLFNQIGDKEQAVEVERQIED